MKPNATARLPAHRVHDGGLSAVRASNRAGTCIAHDEKCNVNASVSSVTARRDGTIYLNVYRVSGMGLAPCGKPANASALAARISLRVEHVDWNRQQTASTKLTGTTQAGIASGLTL